MWLYDNEGNAYLDGLSGIGVSWFWAMRTLILLTRFNNRLRNYYTLPMPILFKSKNTCRKINDYRQYGTDFFRNSGAEANETAIKLSRLYGHKKGIETLFYYRDGACFSRTYYGNLNRIWLRKVQAGFEPLVPGFIRAPFNDLEAIHTIAANRDDIVAIMLEPIQGEGGIFVADDSYLRALEQLCREKEWLFILDEVQTGNGRTGKFFAAMHANLRPDILTTAKGLGNGIPISACLMSQHASNLFKPGESWFNLWRKSTGLCYGTDCFGRDRTRQYLCTGYT